MLAQGPRAPRGIAGLQAIEDLQVLLQLAVEAMPPVRHRLVHELDEVVQLADLRREDGVARFLGDGTVQFEVEVVAGQDERLRPAFRRRRSERLERPQTVGRQSLAGKPHREAFENLADGVNMNDFALAETAYLRAAIGKDLDEAILGEARKCLANRRAADPELGDELELAQRRSRRDL